MFFKVFMIFTGLECTSALKVSTDITLMKKKDMPFLSLIIIKFWDVPN
jgi:hypothetical protein